MKRITSILLCAIAIIFAQGNAFAENDINDEPVLTESAGAFDDRYINEVLTINGPTVIEVNTLNVYGFNEDSRWRIQHPGATYEWELVNVENNSTAFYLGYNRAHICSFICYEPLTLSLRIRVTDGDYVGQAESYITVLPAGSL